jgi:hypothetical protein
VIRRILRLIATFTGLRYVAKLAEFCGGRRRTRQEPHVVLFAAAAGVVVATTVSILTFLHLTAYKGMPR